MKVGFLEVLWSQLRRETHHGNPGSPFFSPGELARQFSQALLHSIQSDPAQLAALAQAFGCTLQQVASHPRLRGFLANNGAFF